MSEGFSEKRVSGREVMPAGTDMNQAFEFHMMLGIAESDDADKAVVMKLDKPMAMLGFWPDNAVVIGKRLAHVAAIASPRVRFKLLIPTVAAATGALCSAWAAHSQAAGDGLGFAAGLFIATAAVWVVGKATW